MKNYISFPRVEGSASRQAHADLPEGTYEREISKEGFFGPATFLYHRHPPTGWIDFEGPLRPRAFDLNRLERAPSLALGRGRGALHNANVEVRFWSVPQPMDDLARNADGDQLLFVHEGAGDLFCDYGHLAFEAGDYLYLPRGTMWRLEPAEPLPRPDDRGDQHPLHPARPRPARPPRASSIRPCWRRPTIDEAFRAQQGEAGDLRVEIKKRGEISTVTYPVQPAGRRRLARRPGAGAAQRDATSGR